MADDALKRGEAIARQAANPRVVWMRREDAAAADQDTNQPLAVLQETSKLAKVWIVVRAWTPGTPSNATLKVDHYRGGVLQNTLSVAMSGAWGMLEPVQIAAPDWGLEKNDVLVGSLTKAGGGYLMAACTFFLELSL